MPTSRTSRFSRPRSIDQENGSSRRAGHADPETSVAECSHRAQETKRASCVEQRLGLHCDSEDEPDAPSIPTSPTPTIDSDESFQCRGLQYDPEQRWSNPSPREPIVWASGSGLGHNRSLYSSSIPASPGTVASDSDESFQCRGLQWQYEPDFRPQESTSASGSGLSRRGGGSRNYSTSPEGVASDSDESFQCRGLSFQSRPDFGSRKSISRVSTRDSDESFQCRGLSYQSQPDCGSLVEESISRASASDSDESFHCRGLSYQSQPEPRRPDHNPQASDSRTSAGGITHRNLRKDKNFLGLRLDLSSISNFQLKETDTDRRQDSSETQALNERMEVDSLALAIVASPTSPELQSPAHPAETPFRQAAMPILGSSKLRAMKLERQNRRKGPLQGIKTALKRILRVPEKN